jgi:hypothetical protein
MTVGSNWIQEIGVDLPRPRQPSRQRRHERPRGHGQPRSRQRRTGTRAERRGHPSAGIFYDDGGDGDFRATTQNFFGSPLGSALSTIGG